MKVALVYDRVNKWGGAERILLALHKMFPQAPLYTSVYNPSIAQWAHDFEIRTSFLQSFTLARSRHDLFALLMPIVFETFSFEEFDLVISVTSEAAKGIITTPKTKHICYCLTPTRYVWSGYDEYFDTWFKKAISYPAISYLRIWDAVASNRPDAYIAISQEAQKRIKTYYNRDCVVVYPPAELTENGKRKTERQDSSLPFPLYSSTYYLVVSRLVPYKRVDLVIQVCNELKVPLKIVGVGSEENRLKTLAGSTVEFLGILTDQKLVEYYKGCKALLFAGCEDFGLTLVEAQTFGKPVIAYKKGGASEIVVHRKTGILFDNQSKDSLISAIKEFEHMSFREEACRKQAEKFGFKNFNLHFKCEIEKIMQQRV